MANLRETGVWEEGIYQLETADPVMGGPDGIDNRAPRQLANRTRWLLLNKLSLAGGNMTGALYAASGKDKGIKGAGDNDTGIEWPQDGVMQVKVDGKTAAEYTPTYIKFWHGGFNTALQNDGNIVVANQDGKVLWHANDTVSKKDLQEGLLTKLSVGGGNMTDTLYAASGKDKGIKGAGDNDTGIEWPQDGVMQVKVDGKTAAEYTPNYIKFWHGSYTAALQNDGNFVIQGQDGVVFASKSITDQLAVRYTKTETDQRYLKINGTDTGVLTRNGFQTHFQTDGNVVVRKDGRVLAALFDINSKAAAQHRHNIAEIDGLNGLLDGKLPLAGGNMTGTLYAASGGGKGIRAAGDNDTGIEWPQDGVMRLLVNGKNTAELTPSYVKYAHGNFTTALQNDGNIVVTDQQNRVVWSSSDTAAAARNAAPSGMIAYYAGGYPPAGWLRANGAEISRTVYADLFAAIGTTYGAGDGRSTFKLPDLRGEFVRGLDDGRNVDAGRVLGSLQQDEYRRHNHVYRRGHLSNNVDWEHREASKDGAAAMYDGDGRFDDGGDRVTTAYSGGVETRPRNIALLACIKI